MQREVSPTTKIIITAIAIYLGWMLATYLLEGRVHLLQKPTPLARLTYAVIANMIIGTVIAIWLLIPSILQRFVTIPQLGFQSPLKRVITAVIVAGLIGFALFVIQKPASLNAIVILNVFSQTLPGSIAEVVICWAVVGTAFESIFFRQKPKKTISITVGATVSTILFGIYHFAHSPPFDQPNMVLFIMYPAVLTSIVFFVGRDIYAAVVFHNFQALLGVMNNVNIESLLHLAYPVIIIAIVSIVLLVISDLFVIRKTKRDADSTPMPTTS